MATKPTRKQEAACDLYAEALLLIAQGVRLDDRTDLALPDLAQIASRLGRSLPGLGLDTLVARTLERRGLALGLPSGTAELITILQSETPPVAMLLLNDEDFVARVKALEGDLDSL